MCDVTENENLTPKQIRNAYSTRLLEMLKNGEDLESPFDEKPSSGPLIPLVFAQHFNLISFCLSIAFIYFYFSKDEFDLKNYYDYEQPNSNNYNRNQRSSDTEGTKNESDENYDSSSPEILYQYTQQTRFVPKESEERQQKPLPVSNILHHIYLKTIRINPVFDLKIEYQFKLLEAKFKEERINLQQQHSIDIQKLLDRKNSEIDNLKASFHKKKKDYEDNIEDLMKKGWLFSLLNEHFFLITGVLINFYLFLKFKF
jgi:hypothetical protein